MQLIVLSVLIIGIAMLGMSIGVLLSNRCLRGSCGGPDVRSDLTGNLWPAPPAPVVPARRTKNDPSRSLRGRTLLSRVQESYPGIGWRF